MSWLQPARVLRFHPHDGSCDVQLVRDGSQYTGVKVLAGMFTTSSGLADWHEPEGNAPNQPGSRTRDLVAVLGFVGESPVVIGFLPTEVSQLLFDRKNFRVNRHASDVYSTLDGQGNAEWAHPSGSFVRVATSPGHEDLTGQDFDGLWKITRNTDRDVWLAVQVANAGGVQALVTIDPAGNVALTHAGNLTVNTAGSATLTAGALTINAPVAINGPSLTHNGVNLGATHVHGGVALGPGDTAGPH